MYLHADLSSSVDPEDLKSIEEAQLQVELTLDPYCLYINSCRETYEHRPLDTDHRQQELFFVWMVYSACTSPHASIGVQGDVWIDCTPDAAKIYFRGQADTWVPWTALPGHDARHLKADGLEMTHPWLPDRCLQFTGLDLGWYPHSVLEVHQKRWDECCSDISPYDRLSVQYIVNSKSSMERASMSRRVFPPTNHPAKFTHRMKLRNQAGPSNNPRSSTVASAEHGSSSNGFYSGQRSAPWSARALATPTATAMTTTPTPSHPAHRPPQALSPPPSRSLSVRVLAFPSSSPSCCVLHRFYLYVHGHAGSITSALGPGEFRRGRGVCPAPVPLSWQEALGPAVQAPLHSTSRFRTWYPAVYWPARCDQRVAPPPVSLW